MTSLKAMPRAPAEESWTASLQYGAVVSSDGDILAVARTLA